MARFIQPSFAKGEIGPALYGRVDIAAYGVALKTARNTIVHATGGISNRPGTKFICPVKTHTITPTLVDFQFKASDTYILEFGNLYMRVIRNDAQVLTDIDATNTITGITAANPGVVTTGTHTYSNGDHVFLTGIVGMTELNDRWFIVSSKSATTFQLTDPYDGSTVIDTSGMTAYSSAGSAGKVFELTTTYATADLPQLKWTQSADTLTITHPTYPPREVTRTGHNAWTIADITFAPSISAPANVVATEIGGPLTAETWYYTVTAVSASGEESLPGLGTGNIADVSVATAADPVAITTVGAHGFFDGDEVEISGFTEMTEVNNRRFTITKTGVSSFTLDGEDGSGYIQEDTGGNTVTPAFNFELAGDSPAVQVGWSLVAGAAKYNIYRRRLKGDIFGLLASTKEVTYIDRSVTPGTAGTELAETDASITPPFLRNPFRIASEFPGAVGYYQQRRVFGGSTGKPDTSDYSQTGNQKNYTAGGTASEAITATLTSRKVNQIRHYVPGKDLMILTDGSEWRINSGDNSGFSADTLKQQPQTEWGASHLRPITIGPVILYVQENLISVRSLNYQLKADAYSGTDLTLLAPQIFDDTTAVSWAFARSPDPLIHVVRADGTAGVFTFDQEQEVLAWCRWDTLGKFKWCAAMRPSSTDVTDAPYFVVERVINGNTVKLIERVASRRFSTIEDAYFVDCGLSLDTALTITGATAADPVVVSSTAHGFSDGDLIDIEGIEWTKAFDTDDNETNPDQLNGRRYYVVDKNANDYTLVESTNGKPITGITEADPGVVTAPAHGFADGDIIGMTSIGGMTEANNNIYKVANKTADTFELNNVSDANIDTSSGFTTYTGGGNIYHAVDGSAFAAYVSDGKARVAVLTLSGLDHLEGETISILADGSPVTGKTVSSGTITLDTRASRIHAGLKYISDFEPLNVEASDRTIQGAFTKFSKVNVRFQKSRGMLIGPNTSQLREMKEREFEKMGEPTGLFTGDREVILSPKWDSTGRFFMRQNLPLPWTILAIIPEITG